MNIATLVYIVDDGEVLMARKTRGVGSGRYFGYGGKKKWWQSLKGCATIETWEESGGVKKKRLKPTESGGIKIRKRDLEPMALVDFYNGEDVPFDNPSFRVMCYRCRRFKGNPIDTVEMTNAKWLPVEQIPFGTPDMKEGDELFVPEIISGIPVRVKIRFSKETKKVIWFSKEHCSIKELNLAA